jgi:hypothetical protein
MSALFWKVMFTFMLVACVLAIFGAFKRPGPDLLIDLLLAMLAGALWWLSRQGQRSIRFSRTRPPPPERARAPAEARSPNGRPLGRRPRSTVVGRQEAGAWPERRGQPSRPAHDRHRRSKEPGADGCFGGLTIRRLPLARCGEQCILLIRSA